MQTLAERWVVAIRRQCPAQLCEAAVPERLCGAHDRGIARAELLGQCGGGKQRRFGAEVEQQLSDAAFGGCERRAAFCDCSFTDRDIHAGQQHIPLAQFAINQEALTA